MSVDCDASVFTETEMMWRCEWVNTHVVVRLEAAYLLMC